MDATQPETTLLARVGMWLGEYEERGSIVLLAVLMLLVIILRLFQFGGNTAPPGSDGGQWLAFSHQMFSGERIKAGFESYPPVVPFIMGVTSFVVPPLMALKLVGILASVAVAVPMFLLLRTSLNHWLSAAVAIAMPLAPYHSEVLIFGGYPQLVGTVFLVFAIYFALRGISTGRRLWFLAAGVATSAAVGSNALTALEVVITGSVLLLIWTYKLWRDGADVLVRRLYGALLWWVAPAILISLLFIPAYLGYFSRAERTPANPLNLTLFQIFDWLGSAWQWEFLLWLSVAAVSIIFIVKATMSRRPVLADASVALAISGLVTLLVLRELRSLHVIEISLLLAIGVLAAATKTAPWRGLSREVWTTALVVIVLGITVGVATVGARRTVIAYNWYEVVNASVLSSMEWLRVNGLSGDTVVATGAPRGHNYGWWIEGYARLPTYMASDPFLFFNVEEREQVAFAQRLLFGETTPDQMRALANSEGVRFLFLDKSMLKRPIWDFVEAGFVSRYENDRIVVLEMMAAAPPVN